MTRDESLAAFNALFTSGEIDPVAVERFRTNMTTDYDTFATTHTANESLQSRIDELTQKNTELRDTNLQLIMMHPNSSSKPNTQDDADEPEPKEPTDDEKQEALDKVIAAFKRG